MLGDVASSGWEDALKGATTEEYAALSRVFEDACAACDGRRAVPAGQNTLIDRMRSTNDAPQSKVAERVRCGSDAGQRRSAGIFQGSNAS